MTGNPFGVQFTPSTGSGFDVSRGAPATSEYSWVHYVDAKIGESEARTKAYMQNELQSALKPIHDDLAKLRELPGRGTLIFTVVGTGFTLATAVLAILAFAGDRFDGGMAASGALATQAEQHAKTIADINSKLDAIEQSQQDAQNRDRSPGGRNR